ncbi:MAG TPA: hypothetical protein VF518_17075, partial [Polyangia bacterium]
TAAYLTWQRQPELQSGESFILDITNNELQLVRFDDEDAKSWVELQPSSDANGSFISLHLSGKDAQEAKEAKDKTPAAKAIPERILRGSEAAKALFERFAPLRAVRALGVMEAAKLKDLGLATAKKHLTVQTRSGRRVFDLAPAPMGGTDPYLRDQADGRVFVVTRSILSDFQAASNSLVERHLHGFRLEDADRASMAAGSAKKEFRVARSADGHGVEIAASTTPDKPDSSARTWHERAFGLWATESLGKGEKPAEGEPELKLRLEYFARGRSLGWVDLAEAAPPVEAVSTAAPAAKKTFYARSENTAGWVKLANDSESLFSEGVKLAGGKI